MAYLHKVDNISCPVCDHKADFNLLYATPFQEEVKTTEGIRWRDSNKKFQGLFVCGHCRSPLCMDLELKKQNEVPNPPLNFLNRLRHEISVNQRVTPRKPLPAYKIDVENMGQNLRQYFEVTFTHPDAQHAIPTHLPENIDRLLKEEVVNVMASPKYLVIACRSVLEAACKDLLENPKEKLFKLIDRLQSEGFITKSIAEWAHTIRELGNEAVHTDEQLTMTEAKELYDFTTTLLELLYTYPARVEALRNR